MDKEILKSAYKEYKADKDKYDKMYEYYKGNTDAMKQYQMVTERSNNKAPCNFIADFIDEEVSYSVGNDVSFVSREGNRDIIEDINYELSHFSESHDINLLEKMLIHSIAYELYYIDKEVQFNSKVISASEGYAVLDDFGSILFFMHFFNKRFDKTNYIDVYTNEEILHYNDSFEEVSPASTHIFGRVPVGIATYDLQGDMKHKTIYSKVKGLQDSYETNLSDISNEISDFRNAYLTFEGCQIDSADIPEMKKLGVIQLPQGKADWLIKNINDSFIQNTLGTLEEKMYQLTKHINHNERMHSNTSSLALKSRMVGLFQKCKLNQKALEDCIKTRLQMLFIYLKVTKNKNYDYKDITTVFVANLPSDDLMTSQIISQLGDRLSTETGLSLLSFIENPQNELDRLQAEQAESYEGESLLQSQLVSRDE